MFNEGLWFLVSISRSLSETEALFKEELFSGHFWKVDSPTRLSSLETTYVIMCVMKVGFEDLTKEMAETSISMKEGRAITVFKE